MTEKPIPAVAAALALGAAALLGGPARADGGPVAFPETYAEGVRYAVVTRGTIREEIFTSRAAIDAVKAGRPLPSGTWSRRPAKRSFGCRRGRGWR